jgi:uncharacterized protein
MPMPAPLNFLPSPQAVLMGMVRAYRLLLSPWLGSSCRFEPTCSAYSLEALQTHGAAAGSYLTLRRIARCHPFCRGGHDPVPPVSSFRPRLLAGSVHAAAAQPDPEKTSP